MSTTPVTLTSIDYLPDNLKQYPLYAELATGIDLALTPGTESADSTIDPTLAAMNLQYHDLEAASAYFNYFVKPIIGTRSAILFAFQLLKVNLTLLEWWQFDTPSSSGSGTWDDLSNWFVKDQFGNNYTWDDAATPVQAPPFLFAITSPTLPTNLDISQLISLVNALKNERSFFYTFKLTTSSICYTDTTGVIICIE